MRKSSKKFSVSVEDILFNLPGHVYCKDKNGVYLGCNHRQAQILGFKKNKEIIGKRDRDLYDEEVTAMLEANDKEVLEKGKSIIREEISRHPNGDTLTLSHKIPLRNEDGEIIAMLGVSLDITELKAIQAKLEQARKVAELASQEAKSEFIQNMSHDLRTALTGLLSVAEVQADNLPDNHEHKEHFLLMRDASREVHKFCETVLEAASLDHRQDTGEPVTFSIDTLITNKVNLFKPALLHKDLTFTVEPLSDNIPPLLGHPLMLERVLINLIGNAIKFTEIGGITIQYGLTETPAENEMTHQLQITVSDSGEGIPADKQSVIFDSFTRLTPSYQGLHKGQGLGLYITKKLIDLMGGTITVASDGIGQGATFRCEIPIKLSSEKVEEMIPIMDKPYRILVADDSNMARFAAVMLLNNAFTHCQVDQVDTVAGIIQRTNEKAYDLLLLDLTFADGNANTAVKYIRNTPDSKNSETPIVALTRQLDQSTYQACLEVGMNTVTKKPLTLPMIQSLAANLLAGQ